jgi:hypothetical protein
MADRYWIGGTGTWNNGSGGRWSNVSGGSGGYGNPGPTDNAIFDANSGGGSVNVATGRQCYNLLLNGFTGTFTGAASTDLIIYGDTVTLTGSSGISMPGNGPRLSIQAGYTSSSCSLYSYGSTIGHILTYNRGVVLQQEATSKNNTQIDTTNSTGFSLNGYNLTIGVFNNNSGCTLTLGTGRLQVIQAGYLNASLTPIVFNQSGTLSASSATLRFTRARATGALSSAINSTQTSLTLVDAYLDGNQTAWPSSGLIQVDNEILSYSSSSGGSKNVTLSGLTRGLYYSGAASHNQYGSVLLLGPYSTTLSSSANPGDTTLYVTDNSQFPGNGYLEVGGEMIAFTGKSGTTAFTGCSRGQTTFGGTSAAYHASGTIVRHSESRTASFVSNTTVGTLEFGTNGAYIMSAISGTVPTTTSLRAGPYLPTNPIGMQYLALPSTGSGVLSTFTAGIPFTYNGSSGTTYLGGGDDDTFVVNLPFNVYFFGTGTQTLVPYSQIYVDTNGYITFGTYYNTIGIPYNCGVPHLKFLSADRIANLYTRDLGNGTFIIWANGADYSDSGDSWTYELHLYQNQAYYDIYLYQVPYNPETIYAAGNGVDPYQSTYTLSSSPVRIALTVASTPAYFNLDGQRGIQGLPSQPVYVRGIPGTDTSTRVLTGGFPTTPNLPYTYVGTPDFIDNFY